MPYTPYDVSADPAFDGNLWLRRTAAPASDPAIAGYTPLRRPESQGLTEAESDAVAEQGVPVYRQQAVRSGPPATMAYGRRQARAAQQQPLQRALALLGGAR